MNEDWTDWSTESLLNYEQSLYDDEFNGEDTWFLRDQVIIELNKRNWGKD